MVFRRSVSDERESNEAEFRRSESRSIQCAGKGKEETQRQAVRPGVQGRGGEAGDGEAVHAEGGGAEPGRETEHAAVLGQDLRPGSAAGGRDDGNVANEEQATGSREPAAEAGA